MTHSALPQAVVHVLIWTGMPNPFALWGITTLGLWTGAYFWRKHRRRVALAADEALDLEHQRKSAYIRLALDQSATPAAKPPPAIAKGARAAVLELIRVAEQWDDEGRPGE